VRKLMLLVVAVAFTVKPGIALAQSPTDHADYLGVRPDPDRVLAKDYVHPVLKK
jgi:hypothetical protein